MAGKKWPRGNLMGSTVRIEVTTADQLDKLLDVFLSAFKDEATTAVWLDLSSEKLKRLYGTLVLIKLKLYLEAGNPILVAIEDSTILGLIILKLHHVKTSKLRAVQLIVPKLLRLVRLVPYYIRAIRMGMADATRSPENLPLNHDVLEAIAVHPDHQGKKIGRRLLDHAHDYLHHNSDSPGIYLMTGEEKNRQIYEVFDYKLIEKRDTKGFVSYHMYRSMFDQ
jgi:GNAT superfamily N-acetyltransferase